MSTKKINTLKFKRSMRKAKRIHNKSIKLKLDVLKFCIYNIEKITIPVNEDENTLLKELFDQYDEIITDIDNNIERYRKYIHTAEEAEPEEVLEETKEE